MSQLEMADFDTAVERVVAGMQSRRALTDHEKRVVAYHEAGHALCGELLPSVDRVHRISIVPRGKALGYTLNLPEEDRYLKTREELIDFMTMLLGGRAAEQLVFGSITTGASDDLKRVEEIAHAMVHEYAMGTGIRSLRVSPERASEATRKLRDQEVRELADEAFRAAERMLDSHRHELDELATTLLRNEVLERKDIDRIMGHVPPVVPDRRSEGELGIAAATAMRPAPRQ
jgi:cell division protease FtsH